MSDRPRKRSSQGSPSAPAGSTAPARSRAATRGRLVESGTDLFARQGLEKTTTVHIARAAGVAAGTFYLHFPDKHALFREIALSAIADLLERLGKASAAAGGGALSHVRARAEEILDFGEEHRSLLLILFGPDQKDARVAEQVYADMVPGIEAGLRRRIEAGELPPIEPAVTAQALAAMWQRVVTWWVEDPSRATRRSVVETLVHLHPFAHLES